MNRLHPLTALLVAAVSGCSDPYAAAPTATATQHAMTEAREGELPGRIPAPARDALARPARRPAHSSDEALRHYARLIINWRADNVGARYRQAAQVAVGQARRDAEHAAASSPTADQLTNAGTTSRGEPIAVLAQPGGWALVVTHEQITPDGGPPRYRVYRAHTRHVDGGVAVDAWEPQP